MEAYLHEHIPLSAAMGITVVESSPERTVLEAPLGPNLNHRATAFGGSISTLAILTGWVHVHFRLRSEGHAVHTVIHRSTVDYTAPITSTFRATCERVSDAPWARLCRGLDRHNKGRVHVDVQIESGTAHVSHFRGAYVALQEADG